MKFLIVLSLASVCLGHYTEKQLEKMAAVSGVCAVELKVTIDKEFVERAKSGGELFPDVEMSKNFIACFLTKNDILTPEGDFVRAKFVEFFADGHNEATVEDIYNKCSTVEGATREDKAYAFHNCYFELKH
ncbi:hypothetical protein quinque_010563 [Culex quinquefasciatus]